MQLDLFSESVSPNGNIQAPGIINQLGRPNLDPLTVLVREAVQNSWDARVNDNQTVDFNLSGWLLDDHQLNFLRKIIFSKRPQNSTLPLDRVLSDDVDVLAVYDRGTLGLGGPTRADIITEKNGARDFVDFLRNVGQPSDREHTGGTYGYGKAAFYLLSKAQTIIIYTRCFFKGKYQSRLIASALGNPFIQNDRSYTGRHWWGQLIGGIVEPIFDDKADEFAQNLGLRVFSNSESGTAILIIAPNFSSEKISDQLDLFHCEKGRSPSQALNFAAESILWYFWPKMIGFGEKKPPMKFSVSWQGENIPIPAPENYPPLKGFFDSMILLKQGKSQNGLNHYFSEITSQRPNKKIGRLALHMFQIENDNSFNTHPDDADKFFGLTHHLAIMRQPELIVKYISGPVLSTEWFGYGGVFIAQKEEDEIFADAEPPTHDNWVAESLSDRKSRTIIRTALRSIATEMENFAKPASVNNSQGILVPLGSFANELGQSLLTSVIGNAATNTAPMVYSRNPYLQWQIAEKDDQNSTFIESLLDAQSILGTQYDQSKVNDTFSIQPLEIVKPDNKGFTPVNGDTINLTGDSTKQIGKAKVKTLSDGEYILVDGINGLNIRFSVQPGENSLSTIVELITFAIVDGNQIEYEPPIGGSSSSVLCWIAPDGTKLRGSEKINIPVEVEGEWQVIISIPEDIMIGIDFKAEARGS